MDVKVGIPSEVLIDIWISRKSEYVLEDMSKSYALVDGLRPPLLKAGTLIFRYAHLDWPSRYEYLAG